MIAIDCPICRYEVTENNHSRLSEYLKQHPVNAHRMSMLSQVRVGYNGESTDQCSSGRCGSLPDVRTIRFLGGYQGRSKYPSCWYGLPAGKSPDDAPCNSLSPIVRGTVAGEDRTALGNHLNKHWTDDHRIRPTLGAEAGIGKGKGH